MINAEEIIKQMQSTCGAETQKGLAKMLGVGVSTVNSWKLRNSVPLEYLVRVALDKDVSLDWLVFGIAGERETRGRTYEEATAKVRPFSSAETRNIAKSLRALADGLDGGTPVSPSVYAEAEAIAKENEGKGGQRVYVAGHGYVRIPLKREATTSVANQPHEAPAHPGPHPTGGIALHQTSVDEEVVVFPSRQPRSGSPDHQVTNDAQSSDPQDQSR